jgi:hypothetical protein
MRMRAAVSNFRLPTAPVLPEIYFGYGNRSQARFEVTPALRRRASAALSVSDDCEGLQGLSELRERMSRAQEAVFDALCKEEQEERLRKAWEAAFLPPTDSANSTGLWLLPHELNTDVYSTTRIFEYFGNLVGAHVFNPARKLGGKTIANPAVELAQESGINLVADLAALAQTQEGTSAFQEMEQRVIGLVPAYRRRINASAAIGDQDLLCAICDYDEPVTIEPALKSLSESGQIEAMRANLKPGVNECCTDEDLLSAVQNPNGPLLAAGLCRVQTLCRDTRVPLGEALTFMPERLRRERVLANFWHDAWSQPAVDRVPAIRELALVA